MLLIKNNLFPFCLYITDEDVEIFCEKRMEQGYQETSPERLAKSGGIDYNEVIELMNQPDIR